MGKYPYRSGISTRIGRHGCYLNQYFFFQTLGLNRFKALKNQWHSSQEFLECYPHYFLSSLLLAYFLFSLPSSFLSFTSTFIWFFSKIILTRSTGSTNLVELWNYNSVELYSIEIQKISTTNIFKVAILIVYLTPLLVVGTGQNTVWLRSQTWH